MIDKIKTILTITLIVIIVFAIGYSIVKLIISAFEKPVLITLGNIEEYTLEEKVVTSHATYYYYESCLANFIEACKKELYNELYDIYIKDYAKEASKEEVIGRLKNINSILTPQNMDEEITYRMDKLYKNDTEYIAQVSINENTVYLVFSESNDKQQSYGFAIVK